MQLCKAPVTSRFTTVCEGDSLELHLLIYPQAPECHHPFVPSQEVLAIVVASLVSKKKGVSASKGPVGTGDAALPLPFNVESCFIASLKPQSQLNPSRCLPSGDFRYNMQMQHTRGQPVRAIHV